MKDKVNIDDEDEEEEENGEEKEEKEEKDEEGQEVDWFEFSSVFSAARAVRQQNTFQLR